MSATATSSFPAVQTRWHQPLLWLSLAISCRWRRLAWWASTVRRLPRSGNCHYRGSLGGWQYEPL